MTASLNRNANLTARIAALQADHGEALEAQREHRATRLVGGLGALERPPRSCTRRRTSLERFQACGLSGRDPALSVRVIGDVRGLAGATDARSDDLGVAGEWNDLWRGSRRLPLTSSARTCSPLSSTGRVLPVATSSCRLAREVPR